MFNKLIAIACIFLMGVSAHAKTNYKKPSEGSLYDADQTEIPDTTPALSTVGSNDLPTINEDWYSLWGLGVSQTEYSGVVGDAYENDAKAVGTKRTVTINADLLGFYWPLSGQQTMMGVILNGSGDVITRANGSKASLKTSLLAFSVHHFFGKNIGDSWFIRGDLGLARASVDTSFGGNYYKSNSNVVIGSMVGGGYGFALGRETRLLIGLYIRAIPTMKFSGVGDPDISGTVSSLTAGLLF